MCVYYCLFCLVPFLVFLSVVCKSRNSHTTIMALLAEVSRPLTIRFRRGEDPNRHTAAASDREHGGVCDSSDATVVPWETNDVTEFCLRCDSLRVRLILDQFDDDDDDETTDHHKSVPFLEAAVRALEVQGVHRGNSASNTSFLREVRLSTLVESRHFNLVIAQWEPVLETSHLDLEVQQSRRDASTPPHVNCNVLCAREVRFCITDNFATQLTAVYSEWRRSGSGSSRSGSSRSGSSRSGSSEEETLVWNERRAKRYEHFFSPYRLENKTG